MKEPQQLQPGKCVRLCVFGLPGAGKTRFACSGDGETLIIRPPTDHTDSVEPRAGLAEIEIEDWNQQLEVFQWGQQGGFKKYDWVWIDGVSLWEEFGLDDVFQAAIDRSPHRAEHGPDKGEYGVNRMRLMKWLRDMVGLSKHGDFNFGVTANVMEWTNPVTSQDLWVPLVGSPSNLQSAKMCGYMNIVAYMHATEKEGKPRRETLLSDADGFVGKDQYRCFPELKSGRHGFINPTMTDVEAAIRKKRRQPTRKRPARKRRTRARGAK